MSNYNNEELIELQNRVQFLEAERDRLRDSLTEMIQYVESFLCIYPLSEEAKSSLNVARKALEGVSDDH